MCAATRRSFPTQHDADLATAERDRIVRECVGRVEQALRKGADVDADLTGRLTVAEATACLSELERMLDRLQPAAVPDVQAGLIDICQAEGVARCVACVRP